VEDTWYVNNHYGDEIVPTTKTDVALRNHLQHYTHTMNQISSLVSHSSSCVTTPSRTGAYIVTQVCPSSLYHTPRYQLHGRTLPLQLDGETGAE
jgi:hypothetical protein